MATLKYQLRHAGSPKVIEGLSAPQITEGLRDGRWDGTDEVRGAGENWRALEDHPHFGELIEELEEPPGPRHEEPTHLDMNALIDVCLVLLIFFILTTTYVISVHKVLPAPPTQTDEVKKAAEGKKKGKGALPLDPAKARNMVEVRAFKDKAGKPVIQVENTTRDVFDDKGNLDPAKLVNELLPEVKRKLPEILLRAEDISWGLFISIQDAARSAGIEVIHHVQKE